MIVGYTTVYALSAYHHWRCEFESHYSRGVVNTTICDKVCQWLAAGGRFHPGTPVSSTYKTDRYNIPEILLKVALNTITISLSPMWKNRKWSIINIDTRQKIPHFRNSSKIQLKSCKKRQTVLFPCLVQALWK